jgi:pimeloyl-ACP methyl ester carboxylesterase
MLPGALLEHNAYAPILSQLSDKGILVMIQNCEPSRVASEGLGSSEEDVKRLIQHLAQTHRITAEKWSIGGHSMGGYTATMIAKKCDYFDSLVLYGVNKSYEIENTSIRALALTASNDGFLVSSSSDLSTFDRWGENDTKGRLLHVVIEGGNHSGFGDYSRQTFPLPDGERTISLEEQHRQIVDSTASFLLQKNK